MIRVIVYVRDAIIALALGWIGVTIQPVAVHEEACPLKGADAAAMCTSVRTPSFDVGADTMSCPGE